MAAHYELRVFDDAGQEVGDRTVCQDHEGLAAAVVLFAQRQQSGEFGEYGAIHAEPWRVEGESERRLTRSELGELHLERWGPLADDEDST